MRTYECRCRPNKKQESQLLAVLIASRRLYNDCLQELVEYYKSTGKHMNLFEQDKRHGAKEHPDLPAIVVDTTLKRLHRSFANFFRGRKDGKRIGFPRFKSADAWNSIQFRDAANCLESSGCSVRYGGTTSTILPNGHGNYLKTPKICGGKLRVNVHRPLEGTFRFARLVLRPSGWYVQCVTDYDGERLAPSNKSVGLDMGITYLVADSDGGFVRNQKSFRASAEKLASAQKQLAKCRKGSRRRRKAKKQVARVHERIANQRKDKLHKVSRSYVNGYGTIVVEDLKPANMVRNHSLALSISDASWGLLRFFLAYKAESAGREFVAVPPHYTSQKCSRCKELVQKSLSVRTHICPYCGHVADRDTNAAQNILQNILRIGLDETFAEGVGGAGFAGESPHPLKREAIGL
jgi:putative transposase